MVWIYLGMGKAKIDLHMIMGEIVKTKAMNLAFYDLLSDNQKEEYQKLYETKLGEVAVNLQRVYPDLLLDDDELRDALGED